MIGNPLTDSLARYDQKSQELAYNNNTDRMRIELPQAGDPAASGVVALNIGVLPPSGIPVCVDHFNGDNLMIWSASGTTDIPVYLTSPIPVAVAVDIQTDAIKVFGSDGGPNIPVYLSTHLNQADDNVRMYSSSGTAAIPVYFESPEDLTRVTEVNSADIKLHTENINTDADKLAGAVYSDNFHWTDNTSKHYLMGGVYNAGNAITSGATGPVAVNASGVLLTTAPTYEYAWPQLTAPGNTASLNVLGNSKHTFQYTVGTINTSIKVAASGSLDNVGWFNLDANDALTSHTSNGTYGMTFDGLLKYTLFSFVEENGGTDATVSAMYLGGR